MRLQNCSGRRCPSVWAGQKCVRSMDNSWDVLFCTARSGRGKTGLICHTQCKQGGDPDSAASYSHAAVEELARRSCRAADLGFVRVRSSPVVYGPKPALFWRQTFPHNPCAFKKWPRSSGVRREFCISSLWKSHYPWKDIFWTCKPGNRVLSGSVPHHLLVHLSNPLTNPCPESLLGKL